jgi:TrpR-related protein YerC/YecD
MRKQAAYRKTESYKPKNEKEKRLVRAFASLKGESEVSDFLRDLLTVAEIEEFANRIEVVRLLVKGMSYQKIARETKVSTTTVTRVAHWLRRGCGGYQRVIDKIL